MLIRMLSNRTAARIEVLSSTDSIELYARAQAVHVSSASEPPRFT